MSNIHITPLQPFLIQGENQGGRWTKWKKAFGYCVGAMKMEDEKQKLAYLLHAAGPELQSVFETFVFDDEPTFEQAVAAIDAYLNPKRNVTFERHEFHRATQELDESVDEFVTRLKQLVLYCEYGDTVNDHVRDQFVDKCYSARLRRRLLRETDLTLDKLLTIARTAEASEKQAEKMENRPKTEQSYKAEHEELNYVKHKSNFSGKNNFPGKNGQVSGSCWRCGKQGHFSKDCQITKGKKCKSCGKEGHFQVVCRTKDLSSPRKSYRKDTKKNENKSRIQYVKDESSSDDGLVFALEGLEQVYVKINNQKVKFVIDTGASVNVISRRVWEEVKQKSDILKETQARVFAYGSEKPLVFDGQCTLNIQVEGKTVSADFIVISGDYPCLLGRKVSLATHLVVIPENRNTIYAVDADLKNIVEKYEGLFQGLGKLNSQKATIYVDHNVQPVVQPMRRAPYHMRKEIEREIERLLQLDIIERVDGATPWMTPVVAVPKSDGSVRLCLDMRQPNKAIIKQKFPIPLVDDVIQEMEGATVISELDFNMGYHQIELEESSRIITTFSTESGVYRYKRLNFGTSTASEIFQHAIQEVVKNCKGVRNISDNMVIYGSNMQQHNERLEAVLCELQKHGLTLNKSKCKFGLSKLDFMGYIISSKGIALGHEKIRSIVEALNPQTVSEVRSFLGLVNYCSKFMPNVADMTAPLRKLIRKQTKWEWSSEAENAFQKLKSEVAKCTELAFFNKDRETELIVDAGPEGLGAVLTQKQKDGSFKPVAFASKVLTEQERKFSQTEREALSVIWGCEKFHLYLYGKEFVIVTDHKPLEVIYSPKSTPSARIERWILRLQQYRYTIRYEKGSKNIADPLSRLLNYNSDSQEKGFMQRETNKYVNYITEQAVPKAMTVEMIRTETEKDQELQTVKKDLETDKWSNQTKSYELIKHELSWNNGILLKGMKIIIPKTLRKYVLNIAHESHQGVIKTKAMIRTKVWWPGIDKSVSELISKCVPCQVQGQPERPEPLKMTDWAKTPWQNVAIDICGPFNTGEVLVVLVDYVSKWPEATITKTATSAVIIKWLETVFACHGYPQTLTSDNGAQFVSKEFRSYLEKCGIKYRNVTPYWPQANGQVERLNKVFLKSFRAAVTEERDWRCSLTDFLRVYRTTPHCSTQLSPAEILFGRQVRTKLPSIAVSQRETSIVKKATRNDDTRKMREKEYADNKRNAKESSIQAGNLVLVKQEKHHKLMTTFSKQPYEVVQKNGNSLILKSSNGKITKRNITSVRKFFGEKGKNEDSDNSEDELDDENYPDEPRVCNNPMNNPADPVIGQNPEQREQERNVFQRPKRITRKPTYLKDYVC